MARAKRTDRADARRRWRQTHLADIDDGPMEDQDAATPPKTRTSTPAGGGLTGALRNAYHPANVREDLAALPGLLRTRAFIAPALAIVGATALFAVAPSNIVSTLGFQTILVPPAMAPIFVAGFFAKRASYLLGFLVAIIDVAAYAFILYVVAPTLTSTPIDPNVQLQTVWNALSIGPISGLVFAGAAAWYRRFLSLSNANNARRRQAQRGRAGKPARG